MIVNKLVLLLIRELPELMVPLVFQGVKARLELLEMPDELDPQAYQDFR